MNIRITHPYLAFPVNTAKTLKKLLFYDGQTLVYESDLRYDPNAPDFTAYLDVRRYSGKTLTLAIDPAVPLYCMEADTIDGEELGYESFRPRYHFTERNGWSNDPNGLVRDAAGVYHMFFQLNPAGPEWGNMHWGHAVSRDLIRWEEKETALFPDQTGTMFSGSAVRDTENVAGFGKDALLFYYTAAGDSSLLSKGTPFTQCLAVSLDNGETFKKYEGNPVLPHICGTNRDPKVIFCPEIEKYVLALYLDGDKYAIFSTEDLLHFTLLQELELPGDAECPDFYPLTADDGTRHWVFSGASGRYLVGDFRDGRFCPEQEVQSLHTGSRCYAAQTFYTLPDGRTVNIAWERISFPCGMPFRSQMSLPVVHTLHRYEDGYRLRGEPVEEASSLRRAPLSVKTLPDGVVAAVPRVAAELLVTLPAEGEEAELALFGQRLVLDRVGMELRLGEERIPMEAQGGKIKLHLFWDVCSLEVFAGSHYACFEIVADENLYHLTLTNAPGAELTGWELEERVF